MPSVNDGEHVSALITAKFFVQITHTPGILLPGDFHPDGNGGCMVPRWKSPDVMVRVSFVSLLMPWHCKNRQNPTFIFQFGGAWCIVLGDGAHEITPLATGLAVCETWKSIALPRSSWLPNNCRKAFACFGQVYLMCLIIVNICPFWARLINVAENCNENRKISCLNLIYFYCR